MLDVYEIKDYIINNSELIEAILEGVGFCKIKDRGHEYRCAYDANTNGTSIRVDKKTLSSFDFGRGIKGDIITLVQAKTNLSFLKTINFICNLIGLDHLEERPKIELPFGGFFKTIGRNKEIYDELKIYDEDILKQYGKIPNLLFLKDGISVPTQIKYEIGYDSMSGRIAIPHRDTKGNLVGIVGRINSSEFEDDIAKYFPIIPFPKSKVLYGYDKNYNTIQEKQIVILAESEKSVMKMDEIENYTCLAVGGSFISEIQIRNIQALTPKIVIVGFDEGLDVEQIHTQARKMKLENPFINIKVGYIYDKYNEIMKKGSKVAPMDLGKEAIQELIKHHMVWV